MHLSGLGVPGTADGGGKVALALPAKEDVEEIGAYDKERLDRTGQSGVYGEALDGVVNRNIAHAYLAPVVVVTRRQIAFDSRTLSGTKQQELPIEVQLRVSRVGADYCIDTSARSVERGHIVV